MDKLEMRVTMTVTAPQALALQAMFEYWNRLGRVGSSRFVAFYVDGDGDFRPDCEMSFSKSLPSLSPKMEAAVIVKDDNGNRKYDYDRIAWLVDEHGPFDEVHSGPVYGPPQWWRVLWHRIRLWWRR